MPKNHKSKPEKSRTDFSSSAFFLFLTGCAAEFYILLLRRYYSGGSLRQMLAWADYLPVLGKIGLAVFIPSFLAFLFLIKFKSNSSAVVQNNENNDVNDINYIKILKLLILFICLESGFVSAASFLTRWNMSVISLLSVLVPMTTALGVLWLLYNRECALSLTMLGAAAFLAWLRYRGAAYLIPIRVLAALYICALIAIIYLFHAGKLPKYLSIKSRTRMIDISAALSAIGAVCALTGSGVAYTALIGLSMIIFGLIVYYTVEQL